MENTVYASANLKKLAIGRMFNPGWLECRPRVLKSGELCDVVLINYKHNSKGPITNVPRFEDWSTHDNWGYSGTGPLSLATNILHHFTGGNLELVEKLKFSFRDEILKQLPMNESCVLYRAAIESWIEENK